MLVSYEVKEGPLPTATNAISDKEKIEQTVTDTIRLPVIGFVVGGDHESAMGFRARAMAAKLSLNYDIQIAYRSRRKVVSILKVFAFLVRRHPVAVYVFDISYTGVIASALYKFMFSNLLIIETGDAISELVRSTGSRGKLGIWLTSLL
jgi:hypothetical protein